MTQGGIAYIALDHRLRSRPPLDLRARLHLFLKVSCAAEAAHCALIVHRDLKPSNVLVTVDGQVKLLVVGIA